jgi:two-component system alkaline phosphatase synthesis response regulator PhoP
MDAKILIVEDEPGLVTTLKDRLRKEGYKVTAAADGTKGLELATNSLHDLIILDLMLPGIGGMEICQRLRQDGVSTPILMLTARRQTKDKVAGFNTGADDYLTKPFQMAELLARIQALLRRPAPVGGGDNSRYRFGPVQLDIRKMEVLRDGHPVPLSAKEFQLLRYFAAHQGATLSREELLHEVWGYEGVPSTRTVDVHVGWLRQKLEVDPKYPQMIVTVVGLGYKFSG